MGTGLSPLDDGHSRRQALFVGVGAIAAGGLVGRISGSTAVRRPDPGRNTPPAPNGGRTSALDPAASRFTKTFQRTIDTLSAAGGGTIVLLEGGDRALPLGATIRLKSNVRVCGSGKNATRIWVLGDYPAFASSDPSVRTDNCEISNLQIIREASDSTSALIDCTGLSHSLIEDVTLEQRGSRGNAVGIKFGALSYYNRVQGVQIREVHTGMQFAFEANGNRVIGNNVVLNSEYGYVIDGCNSVLLEGASAEHIDQVAVSLTNGAKNNQIIGCRVEDAPVGYQVLFGEDEVLPAFDNYFIANAGYPREPNGVTYDIQTGNAVIDQSGVLSNGTTYVDATLSTDLVGPAAGTWSTIRYGPAAADSLREYSEKSGSIRLVTSGMYCFTAAAIAKTDTAEVRVELSLFVNGVERYRLDTRDSTIIPLTHVAGTVTFRLLADDTVDVRLRSAEAGIGVAAGQATTFTATRIR